MTVITLSISAVAFKNALSDIAVKSTAPVLAKALASAQKNSGSAEAVPRLNFATTIQDGPRCKVVRIEPDSHTVILDHFDGGTVGTAV